MHWRCRKGERSEVKIPNVIYRARALLWLCAVQTGTCVCKLTRARSAGRQQARGRKLSSYARGEAVAYGRSIYLDSNQYYCTWFGLVWFVLYWVPAAHRRGGTGTRWPLFQRPLRAPRPRMHGAPRRSTTVPDRLASNRSSSIATQFVTQLYS